MKVSLSKKGFCERCGKGKIPVLSLEIPFRKPASIYGKIAQGNSIFLESAKGPERIARYSFISFDPYLEYRVKNSQVEIVAGGGRGLSRKRPLRKLKELLDAYPHEMDNALPPFQGGAIGLISYEFVRYFEKLPKTVKDDLRIPDAHLLIVDKVISFDHRERKAWITVCPGARAMRFGYHDLGPRFHEYYDEAETAIAQIRDGIEGDGLSSGSPPVIIGKRNVEIDYEMDKRFYMDMVKRTKEYIKAGDIFQANLSQRISSNIEDMPTWKIYEKLTEINPSPFAAYARFGYCDIVSSSPERLVKLRKGIAQTRPIAGTRPRGKNLAEDEYMRKELILNEKERAEHIMLIDLERNDMGKVCDYGSVEVDELMITEDYSHVMHIVSNVKGALARHKDCFDLIRAMFPGGTITGVPKVRCMEIIDELEPVARGPYTGSIGYIGFSGEMDLNIVIRTFVCKDDRAYVHVGAGIVADSDPEREYTETLKKGEALIKTLFEVS